MHFKPETLGMKIGAVLVALVLFLSIFSVPVTANALVLRAGGTESKYLFTGQEKDSETGLYYYGARYYNPEIMRFAQPDPIISGVYNPQNLNRYSYVENNPLNYVDPSGYGKITWAKKFAIGIVKHGSLAMGIAAIKSDFADLAGRMEHEAQMERTHGVLSYEAAAATGEVLLKAGEIAIFSKSDVDDLVGLVKGGGRAIGLVNVANDVVDAGKTTKKIQKQLQQKYNQRWGDKQDEMKELGFTGKWGSDENKWGEIQDTVKTSPDDCIEVPNWHDVDSTWYTKNIDGVDVTVVVDTKSGDYVTTMFNKRIPSD